MSDSSDCNVCKNGGDCGIESMVEILEANNPARTGFRSWRVGGVEVPVIREALDARSPICEGFISAKERKGVKDGN